MADDAQNSLVGPHDAELPRSVGAKATVFGTVIGAAATVPTWTTAGFLSLFGLAGASAVSIAGWMMPIFVGVTIVALGRSYYLLYVLKKGNLFSKVLTWAATALVAGFWVWHGVSLACQ